MLGNRLSRTRSGCILSALFLVLLVPTVWAGRSPEPVDDVAVPAVRIVCASIPYGSGEGLVGHVPHLPERIPKGPESIAVGREGDLFVLDAINARLRRYDPNGRYVSAIEVDARSQSAVVSGDTAFVVASGRLFAYGLDGTRRGSLAIPASAGILSAIHTTDDDALVFVNSKQELIVVRGPTAPGEPMDISSGGEQRIRVVRLDEHAFAVIESGDRTERLLRTRERLGSASFLGFDRAGNRFLVVETITAVNPLEIERYVCRLAADGRFVGSVRLTAEYASFPTTDLFVNADGFVYQLSPEQDRVVVYRFQVTGGE